MRKKKNIIKIKKRKKIFTHKNKYLIEISPITQLIFQFFTKIIFAITFYLVSNKA